MSSGGRDLLCSYLNPFQEGDAGVQLKLQNVPRRALRFLAFISPLEALLLLA